MQVSTMWLGNVSIKVFLVVRDIVAGKRSRKRVKAW
jgi:mannose/fructose/N-acetylgalactosamine-specific phosphotransferase system component IIB